MQLDRLRDILVFMCMLECGNLSAAARSFSLSPSTVSKLITRLEDRLHTWLLDRSFRTLSATAAGSAFHRSCLAVMASLQDAEGAVLAHGRMPLGTLRLHTVQAFAEYQLFRVLPEFLARYPGIEVELILDVTTRSC